MQQGLGKFHGVSPGIWQYMLTVVVESTGSIVWELGGSGSGPYEKVEWYSHGATMVYHGKQWYTMARCNCTMVQITCTMVDYGIPWYILTVPWHILVQPWFTELVPWCIMIYHGTSLHNHSTIYL